MTSYQGRVEDVLANAQRFHDAFYQAKPFGGPSLHFHKRALETRQSPSDERHLEYVYATLVSWGMHRMGKGGSKMEEFESFRQSVNPLKERIAEAQQFAPENMGSEEWAVLEGIFRGIKVMESGTSLVGNSKVMHQMMPNVVPPIDREYTLRYLRGNKTISNSIDLEWDMMKGIISGFFLEVARDAQFGSKAAAWVARQEEYPWDTSVMKVIDNLVIASMKLGEAHSL